MNMSQPARTALWFALGLVISGLALAGLAFTAVTLRAADPFTVRSYPVAPEIAGEMEEALDEVLNKPIHRGSVIIAPNGHLLVQAPRSVQADVQAILQDVAAQKPGPTPAIKFEVWLVAAAPGTEAKADNGPGMAEIVPALGDLQKTQKGPEALHFNLLEKLAVQVRAGGNESQIEGARADMEIRDATVRKDAKGHPVIAAQIALKHSGNKLKAAMELPAGQLLVLGQSNLPGSTAAGASPSQLYYFVRASL